MRRLDADVAVVGAGFAGLAAARALERAGRTVAVLEARDRVGGRTLSEEAAGVVVDMGAQWTGPEQTTLLGLARELGVQALPVQRQQGDFLQRSGGEVIREPLRAIDSAAVDAVRQLDELSLTVPLERPWEAEHAEAWDSCTFQSWLDANVSPEGQLDLLMAIIGFMSHPRDFSLLHLLFYARSNHGLASMVGLAEPHDSIEFEGGVHEVALRIAGALSEPPLLGTTARAIRQHSDGVVVTADAAEVRAGHAVVCVPSTLATQIELDPPLPYARDQLMRRMPLKSAFKIQVVYDEPFWRADGLSGSALDAWFKVFDSSPRDKRRGVLTLLAADVSPSRDLSRLAGRERERRVIAGLTELFGSRAAHPLAYRERFWGDEPHSRGSVMIMTPGTWVAYGRELRNDHGRVLWAGTETAPIFCGQVEGAARSGEGAARRILA